jgi:hypothetical protein
LGTGGLLRDATVPEEFAGVRYANRRPNREDFEVDPERSMMMNRLVPWIWAAGIIQWVIAAANVFIPRKLGYADNVVKMSTIVRQIFVVHAVYIVGVLVGLGAMSIWFAQDLASGQGLGRFASVLLAVFWLPRIAVQLLYYDERVRARHRAAHCFFTSFFIYLGVVFTLAATRVMP